MPKILIKRMGARGDVLLASAIATAIKKKDPQTRVFFLTGFPDVLLDNQYVDQFVDEEGDEEFDRIYDLDSAYENRPNVSILEAFANKAEVDLADCEPHIRCAPVNKPLFVNYVVIHAGKTNWVGRNWIEDRFRELSLCLHEDGLQIICVGDKQDAFVPCDTDARSKTTVQELATIIRDAKLFIGIDSFPFQVAQTLRTPSVCFFGSINPKLRVFRDNVTPVQAQNLPCLGCHHRKPPPIPATHECETGTLDCEKWVTIEMMMDAIRERAISP